MITIVPYQPTWPEEFLRLCRVFRQSLGELALRIDHIGSTSVPGLAAKDRIDVQITVVSLSPEVEQALVGIGCRRVERITGDHIPPEVTQQPEEWAKWFFQPPDDWRPTNIHVRLAGRANQRYALLFRDYLRASPAAAQAYAQVKIALARHDAEDVDAYYEVKDPVTDIILAGAEVWAAANHWEPGASGC